jgi:3-oxoacyl-(acyl-carrier-protein) reductase
MTAPAERQTIASTGQRPLAGHVAVVTGASRGIGAAIARELGANGANLVIDYATSSTVAEELARAVVAATPGVDAIALQADVADEAQARGLIANAIARFGRIDILVNNAGITRDRTLRKMTSAQWREVIETDLNGVFYCTQSAVEQMITQGNGRIVNISSVIAESGNIGQTNYAAAKGGMISFTRSLALELARYGITANCVAPGFIETDMVATVPDEIRTQIVSRIPLQRFGQPEEIARVVRFLCVEGGYITGQVININGGLYM